MPPKFKFSKEQIIQAALELTREGGISSVTAKNVGEKLNSSVKVVFGQFANMEEVRSEVVKAADEMCRTYMQDMMESGKYPPYKASGIAYISFAKEEKELFKLLYMRDRSQEKFNDKDDLQPLVAELQKITGFSEDDAYRFQLEMWMYVHGIAVMIATSYLEWDMDMINSVLSDAYLGLKYRFSEKNLDSEK